MTCCTILLLCVENPKVDGRRPPAARQAWGGSSDGHNNFQPQWIDAGKQGQYNTPEYNAQRQWSSHFQQQQRSAYGMGPPPGPNTGGRPPPQDHRSGMIAFCIFCIFLSSK